MSDIKTSITFNAGICIVQGLVVVGLGAAVGATRIGIFGIPISFGFGSYKGEGISLIACKTYGIKSRIRKIGCLLNLRFTQISIGGYTAGATGFVFYAALEKKQHK
jgi:hypothetical protein